MPITRTTPSAASLPTSPMPPSHDRAVAATPGPQRVIHKKASGKRNAADVFQAGLYDAERKAAARHQESMEAIRGVGDNVLKVGADIVLHLCSSREERASHASATQQCIKAAADAIVYGLNRLVDASANGKDVSTEQEDLVEVSGHFYCSQLE